VSRLYSSFKVLVPLHTAELLVQPFYATSPIEYPISASVQSLLRTVRHRDLTVLSLEKQIMSDGIVRATDEADVR